MKHLRAAIAFLIFLSGMAQAEVCDTMRSHLDLASGARANLWTELIALSLNPVTLVLLALSIFVTWKRHANGALAVVLGWSMLVSMIVFWGDDDASGLQEMARAEGCIGSPALFIALVIAICAAMIFYTAPNRARPET